MVEEVDVKVSEVDSQEAPPATPLFEGLRRLVLASIGAMALTRDEVEGFVNRLVDRGEIAQKDAEHLIREVQSRLRAGRVQPAQAEERSEGGLEQLLSRLNIPSKRDIDDLSAKVAQLAARVEELRRTKE